MFLKKFLAITIKLIRFFVTTLTSVVFLISIFPVSSLAIVSSDPVSYYNFEEGSGDILYDLGLYENHGTVFGASWDNSEGALRFDGEDDYVDISGVNYFYDSFTITAWVKFDVVNRGQDNIVLGGGGNDWVSNYSNLIIGEKNGKVFFTDGFAGDILGSTDIEADQWVHLAFTFNNGLGQKTLRIYVDGIEEISTSSGVSGFYSDSLEIGHYPGSQNYFKGLIDELRIFRKDLSSSEIQSIYGDEQPPESSITFPANNLYVNNFSTVTINGSASDDDSGVWSMLISTNGGTSWDWINQFDNNWQSWRYFWNPTIEGIHNIKTVATDAAGNQEAPEIGVNLIVDRTAPQVSISGPDTINTNAAIFSFSSSDNLTQQSSLVYSYALFSSNKINWSAYSNSTSANLSNISIGTHTLAVKAKDLAGNEGFAQKMFVYKPTVKSVSYSILSMSAVPKTIIAGKTAKLVGQLRSIGQNASVTKATLQSLANKTVAIKAKVTSNTNKKKKFLYKKQYLKHKALYKKTKNNKLKNRYKKLAAKYKKAFAKVKITFWKTIARVKTNSKGQFVKALRPKTTTIYKAEFAGDSAYKKANSNATKITVKKPKKKAKAKKKKK